MLEMEPMLGNNTVVSILCMTYNQEKYILDALDGFMRQETTFPYEVIVHDDASTDGTRRILESFKANHPENVQLILQTENQYSQGGHIIDFFLGKAKGKYVAICEGDDYWTDPRKLQLQVEYMDSHPECSACTHAVRRVDSSTNEQLGLIAPSDKRRQFSVDEVIVGGGGMFGTNSFLFRSEYLVLPELYRKWGVGDYPRAIYLATEGPIGYLPDEMSVYRVSADGSWSVRMAQQAKARWEHSRRIIGKLEEYDFATNKEHTRAVRKHIRDIRIDLAKDKVFTLLRRIRGC